MAKHLTPSNRSYREEVKEGLDILWDTANRIVIHIQEFIPQVVISLLHSGWAPAKAARMLWQATQTDPFPPLVMTNLGREKLIAYPGGSKKVGNVNFLGMYSEPFQIGHFLAWLEGQVDWQAQLKDQVQSQLPAGSIPQRIVLVDDWIAEGNTFILALGLMDIIYPGAEKHFVSGTFSWKRGFERLWLELYHPQLLKRLELSQNEGGYNEDERRVIESHLIRLIPGTEDVRADSFEWQPVTVSSPWVSKLSAYLPAEELLNLPGFVDQLIEDYMRDRIQEYQRGMLDSKSLSRYRDGGLLPQLGLDTLVLRDLWLDKQGITRRRVIEKYNLSAGQASRLLKGMLRRGLLIRRGYGRAARYFLHPEAYPAKTE
jgi:hypothetical protein